MATEYIVSHCERGKKIKTFSESFKRKLELIEDIWLFLEIERANPKHATVKVRNNLHPLTCTSNGMG